MSCAELHYGTNTAGKFGLASRALSLRPDPPDCRYSAARAVFETGLGLLIPMYYEHPELAEAYLADPAGNFGQYFFGTTDVFAAPITAPMDNKVGLGWC